MSSHQNASLREVYRFRSGGRNLHSQSSPFRWLSTHKLWHRWIYFFSFSPVMTSLKATDALSQGSFSLSLMFCFLYKVVDVWGFISQLGV